MPEEGELLHLPLHLPWEGGAVPEEGELLHLPLHLPSEGGAVPEDAELHLQVEEDQHAEGGEADMVEGDQVKCARPWTTLQ